MKVTDLKAELAHRGLSTTGLKSVLEARLSAAMEAEDSVDSASSSGEDADAQHSAGRRLLEARNAPPAGVLAFNMLPPHLRPIARRAVLLSVVVPVVPVVLCLAGLLGLKGAALFFAAEIGLSAYATVVVWNPSIAFLLSGPTGPSGAERTCGGKAARRAEGYSQADWDRLAAGDSAGGAKNDGMISAGDFYEEYVGGSGWVRLSFAYSVVSLRIVCVPGVYTEYRV